MRDAFVVLSDPSWYNKTSAAEGGVGGPSLCLCQCLPSFSLSEYNLTLSAAPHFIIAHVVSPLNNLLFRQAEEKVTTSPRKRLIEEYVEGRNEQTNCPVAGMRQFYA